MILQSNFSSLEFSKQGGLNVVVFLLVAKLRTLYHGLPIGAMRLKTNDYSTIELYVCSVGVVVVIECCLHMVGVYCDPALLLPFGRRVSATRYCVPRTQDSFRDDIQRKLVESGLRRIWLTSWPSGTSWPSSSGDV